MKIKIVKMEEKNPVYSVFVCVSSQDGTNENQDIVAQLETQLESTETGRDFKYTNFLLQRHNKTRGSTWVCHEPIVN